MIKPTQLNQPNPLGDRDGLFRFSSSKQNLTVREVADALGISAQSVRDLLDEGLLMHAAINDKAVVRESCRIARFSVVAFWRERLAEKGFEPPFQQSEEVIYFRAELRKRKKLPGLGGKR